MSLNLNLPGIQLYQTPTNITLMAIARGNDAKLVYFDWLDRWALEEKDPESLASDYLLVVEADNTDLHASYSRTNFEMPKNTDVTQEVFEDFLESMYKDLIKEKIHVNASLGIWIEYDNKKYENAITLDTLSLIKKYSTTDVKSIYEFFKMTLAK